MPRLRTVSTQDPGWRRVHHGRGHRYLDVDGTALGKEEVERVKALVIPPAWRDVWISPYPNAHLQAVGTDDAGRRQYLYHPAWRAKRDEAKFDRVIEMAAKLPDVRRRLRADLDPAELDRDTALAAAVRLVDLGCFRLGSDSYTEQNGSYGLTTLERRHVRRSGESRVFSFTGKSGVDHEICLTDPELCQVIDKLTLRRKPDARVLCAREGRRWVPLQAADINDHIRDLFGLEVTAKDFRTWHATVHVAIALGDSVLARTKPVVSKTARSRTVRQAVVSASELLGNTPTVCRSSYVDPRVLDLYESDVTIAAALEKLPKDEDAARDHVDLAVVELLSD
ncbi:MAG TPA: DNA topoisomerase IB [Marmoricola sp.]|nr:DNA topoisomerase IB [Marmoricola sp.]